MQNRIYKIIKRLSDDITDEQRHSVWYWLVRSKNDAEVDSVIEKIWHESGQYVMTKKSLDRSWKATREKINQLKAGTTNHEGTQAIRKLHEKRKNYWLAAACISVILLSSSLLFMLDNPFTPSGEKAAFIGQPMPSDDIQLISGKSIMKLSQDAHIELNRNGQVSLVNEKKKSEIILPKNEINRLIVPFGKRSTLELPDGTKVWMNSGTELEFPSEFKGNTREIFLKGEIYIEVARMEKKPFFVHTSDFTVQVFGTKFNVCAYPDHSEKTVVLAEGKVEVNTAGKAAGKLLPNEMFTIGQGGMQKQEADVAQYTSWKDGILLFNKTPISDVLQKVGRYYNVSFDDFSDKLLSEKTCTGKLYLSENLDEVLMSVALLSKTSYYKQNGIIYIRNKIKLN